MKSNGLFLAGTAVGTALLFSSCHSPGHSPNQSNTAVERCVDKDNRVVDDKFCEESERQRNAYLAQPGHSTNDSFFQQYLLYRWLFGGPRGQVPVGAVISGGSTARPNGVSYYVRPTSSAEDPTVVRTDGTRVGTLSSFTPSEASGTTRGVFGGAGEAAAGHGGEGGGGE